MSPILATREWVSMVASLINPAMPGDGVRPLNLLMPTLLDEFDARCFTALSARCVAEAERFSPVPDYRVVVRALREYRRDHVPNKYDALPPPSPVEPPVRTAEEVARVQQKLTAWRHEVADSAPQRVTVASAPSHLSPEVLAHLYARDGLVNPRHCANGSACP